MPRGHSSWRGCGQVAPTCPAARGSRAFALRLAPPGEAEVELPQLGTEKEGGDSPHSQKDPEWQGVPAPYPPRCHEEPSSESPAKSSEEYGQRSVGPKESAEHSSHLDVTHAHTPGVGQGKREQPTRHRDG